MASERRHAIDLPYVEFTHNVKSALRYVAGYVCRDKLEKFCASKDSYSQCLISGVLELGAETAPKTIDHGCKNSTHIHIIFSRARADCPKNGTGNIT
jgi:hypothetical protein